MDPPPEPSELDELVVDASTARPPVPASAGIVEQAESIERATSDKPSDDGKVNMLCTRAMRVPVP